MTGSTISTLVTFAVIIVIFYFLLIRPENKKKKTIAAMRASLAVGDEIMTIGGVVGKICAIDGDLITIETGEDRVRIQFDRAAVSSAGMQMLQNGGKNPKKAKEEQEAVDNKKDAAPVETLPAETSERQESEEK